MLPTILKMKRQFLFWVIVLTLTNHVVLGQDNSSYKSNGKAKNIINDSLQAPLFKVVDLNGDSIILNRYLGKVVILNFWYTHCPPCIAEIPGLNYLVNKYKAKDVIFIAITQDSKQQVQIFFKKNGVTFLYHQVTEAEDVIKSYVDAPLKAKGYDTFAFTDIRPANIIIDQYGMVYKYFIGGLDGHISILENKIEQLLNQK